MNFEHIMRQLCRWIGSRNSDFIRSDLIHVLEIDENNEVTGYIIVEEPVKNKVKINGELEIPFDIYSILGKCLAYLTLYGITGLYLVVSSEELVMMLKDAIKYLALPLGLILFRNGSLELILEPQAADW